MSLYPPGNKILFNSWIKIVFFMHNDSSEISNTCCLSFNCFENKHVISRDLKLHPVSMHLALDFEQALKLHIKFENREKYFFHYKCDGIILKKVL